MPKKGLDVLDVDTVLKQVTGEAVTAGMRGNAACNTSLLSTYLEKLIDACDIKIVSSP